MHKKIVFALCGCWLALVGLAQTANMAKVLNEVEQNNQELKALSEYVESRGLELKASNNLPDPQFGAYYLPFGIHNTSDYTEYQISQTIEFPSVYSARSSLIEQETAQLKLEYRAKRQEILAQAMSHCLNLIYLGKQLETENIRVQQARQLFDEAQALYEKEQIGILELNKAKVLWMKEQFKTQQIESDISTVLLQLKNLNGGMELRFSQSAYATSLILADKDSIWQNKYDNDPALAQLQQQASIAQQSLKLAKQKAFPNLTAGYNSQGVASERFSGLYAGVSIPLFSNRNKVKAAQSQLDYQQSATKSKTLQAYAEFEKRYHEYQITLAKYQEYQNTLSALNSDELLLKAYQMGELSFLEYYMELQFYRQAYDAMLSMQYQLHLSKNQLLKHQL